MSPDYINRSNTIKLTQDLFLNESKEHSRIHAKSLDRFFGFKIPKIEEKLVQKYRAYDCHGDDSSKKKHYKGTQTWIGLHPQALQTPYCDIYGALRFLDESVDINHVVDIGAGYGRVGLVLNSLVPEARFTGYEILKQRAQEGNRVYSKFNLNKCQIKLENVLEEGFDLPDADIYFIYDFSEKDDINQVLRSLKSRQDRLKFYLIIRGDRIDRLINTKFKHVWGHYADIGSSDLKVYGPKAV